MSDNLIDVYQAAEIRQDTALDNIKHALKVGEGEPTEDLYYACCDFVEITDFLDTLDEMMDTECPVCEKCKCAQKDTNGDGFIDKKRESLDEAIERTAKAGKTLIEELAKKHKGKPVVETKIARSEDGEDWQEMPLNEEQKKKVAELLMDGDMEKLTDYLDSMLDKNLANLQEHLPQLGEELKSGRNDLREKKERTEKDNERLEALEKLFKQVREAFSDD